MRREEGKMLRSEPLFVARRSWLEISLWKTGKDRKKEKEHTGKKRDGIQTAELDRRDQVTATGPGSVPFERGEQRSIIR